MTEPAARQHDPTAQEAEITAALGPRSIVLVGMMGAGKSTIGRRLAARLRLQFLDADHEIEQRHGGMTIPEIFAEHGEPYFRDGEARVIAALLDGPSCVLATGAGPSCGRKPATASARSPFRVWLQADGDVILRRVKRRADRPLLQTADPAATIERLIVERSSVLPAR